MWIIYLLHGVPLSFLLLYIHLSLSLLYLWNIRLAGFIRHSFLYTTPLFTFISIKMLSLNPGFNFATGPFAQGLQPSMLPLYSPVNDFDLFDNEIMPSQEMPYFYQQQQQQQQQQQGFEQGLSLNSYPYRLSNDLYYQNQFRDVNNSMYSTKPIYHQHVRPSYPTRQGKRKWFNR